MNNDIAITIMTKKEDDSLILKLDTFEQDGLAIKLVMSEFVISMLKAYSREEKFELVMRSED